MSKYQRWHDQIIERARRRKPLGCYCETHHILPRSLGGDDFDSNLVSLTYREHFLIHWILTKIHIGGARRRMQMALHAMLLKVSPGRVVASWQIEVARNSVGLLEDDPEMWVVRSRNVVAEREAHRHRLLEKGKTRSSEREEFKLALPAKVSGTAKLKKFELNALASRLLGLHKRVKIPVRHSSDKTDEEREVLRRVRGERKAAKTAMRRESRTDFNHPPQTAI